MEESSFKVLVESLGGNVSKPKRLKCLKCGCEKFYIYYISRVEEVRVRVVCANCGSFFDIFILYSKGTFNVAR